MKRLPRLFGDSAAILLGTGFSGGSNRPPLYRIDTTESRLVGLNTAVLSVATRCTFRSDSLARGKSNHAVLAC